MLHEHIKDVASEWVQGKCLRDTHEFFISRFNVERERLYADWKIAIERMDGKNGPNYEGREVNEEQDWMKWMRLTWGYQQMGQMLPLLFFTASDTLYPVSFYTFHLSSQTELNYFMLSYNLMLLFCLSTNYLDIVYKCTKDIKGHADSNENWKEEREIIISTLTHP